MKVFNVVRGFTVEGDTHLSVTTNEISSFYVWLQSLLIEGLQNPMSTPVFRTIQDWLFKPLKEFVEKN